MKLSKKKIREIDTISFSVEIIRKHDPQFTDTTHWTETLPENWSEREKQIWDMMFELEDRLIKP